MEQLVAYTIIAIMAVISPGPDFAIVIKNSLAYSRKAGVYTALGIGMGLSVHVLYTLVGIGFIISRSILLFNLIKYLGAAYLIYLGISALLSKSDYKLTVKYSKKEKELPFHKAFLEGFLTNVLNPKATLFFVGVFTQLIDKSTPLFIQAFYGLEIMTIAFIWFSVLAVVLSHSLVQKRIAGAQKYFVKAMGGILILLGVKVILTKAN